jgi:hypothetical protein
MSTHNALQPAAITNRQLKSMAKYEETDNWLKMTDFWDIAPCSLVEVGRRFVPPPSSGRWISRSRLTHRPDNGSGMHLGNVGLLKRDYTALYPTKMSSSYSTPWEPEIRQKTSCSWNDWRGRNSLLLSETILTKDFGNSHDSATLDKRHVTQKQNETAYLWLLTSLKCAETNENLANI